MRPSGAGRADRPAARSPGTTSVIIANYNYAPFLGESIDSALTQGAEVVVVDDGSTDGSGEVLDRYADRVTALRQPNGGQAAAWNTGFAAAHGDVVLFLDSDDRLRPDVLAACREAFARHPGAARVHYPMRCIDARGLPTGHHLPADVTALPSGDLRARVLSQPDDVRWQPTSGNAYRAEVLDRVMPVPTDPYRISADHYLLNITALLGPVVALDRVGADYRVHGDNADFRDEFDVERARATIIRTMATHDEIRRVAAATGPDLPAGGSRALASTSFLANRLASLRLDRALHPVPEDRVARLCLAGVAAAGRRRDLPGPLRLAWATWFVATAVVPRAAVPRLAREALRSPTRPRPVRGRQPRPVRRPG